MSWLYEGVTSAPTVGWQLCVCAKSHRDKWPLTLLSVPRPTQPTPLRGLSSCCSLLSACCTYLSLLLLLTALFVLFHYDSVAYFGLQKGGGHPPLFLLHPLLFPPLPLEVEPLIQLGGLWERCKLPQHVRWTIFAEFSAEEKGFWWEQFHVHIHEKYSQIWQVSGLKGV